MFLLSKNKIVFVEQEELEDFSCLSQDPFYKECWRDKEGRFHREDGPALLSPYDDQREDWYIHGKHHREGGPAFKSRTYEGWMVNDRYHREDGPAYTVYGKHSLYYLNGLVVSEEEVRALGKMK